MEVGTEVTWPRSDLPDGEGVVVEVKDTGIHMVRDSMNNLYGFHPDLHELRVKDSVALSEA
jgi:hypothetical protein